jgi:hypothetical protein
MLPPLSLLLLQPSYGVPAFSWLPLALALLHPQLLLLLQGWSAPLPRQLLLLMFCGVRASFWLPLALAAALLLRPLLLLLVVPLLLHLLLLHYPPL